MVMARRRPNRRGIVIVVLVVILVAMIASSRFYTDVLWFQEVGFESVLFKSIYTQFLVGLAVGLVVAALVWGNLLLAARTTPAYRIPARRGDPLERYRELLAPYGRWLRLGIAALIGVFAGMGAAGTWQNYLLWANRVPFGRDDPQFGRDIGFFVFELPWLKDLTDFAWFALITALIVSVAAHFFYGSIRPDIGMRGVPPAVLAHLSVLLGGLALVKAVQYWLGRYELDFSARGVVTGASYTDVNAQLPALTILAIISVVSAILFLVNIRLRTVSLPLAAVGIWILFSVLAGGLWPWWVQRFSVEPQELERERPYIQRNLEATREAFDLSDVTSEGFAATQDLTSEDVQQNEDLLQNIRLWAPDVLQRAYEQLQALRPYYEFGDVDVDRYEIEGETRQVLLSARELSLEQLTARSWTNLHLQYTHGYGLVASLANATTTAGQPDFLVRDVPGTAEPGAEALDAQQPRIYFGESFEPDEYSIVNTRQAELDFDTEEGTQRTNYAGEGGISIGGILKQFAFGLREFDQNIILSNQIDGDSKILLYRNLRDRVRRVAPFLALDSDPYPVVVEDRIVWLLDAYTETEWYPYSERFPAGDIVGSSESGALSGTVNYARNSVKVAVDAYDGTITLYVIDEEDPLIQVWRKAFPDLFTDEDPPDELAEHFRYPEDLFKLQSEVHLAYHIPEADDFYSRADEWQVARTVDDTHVEPTYLLISLPSEVGDEFVLTRPFSPRGRSNMIALMVARSDPANYGELLTLQFPRSIIVPGPSQVDNVINQDVEISRELTLLRSGGSDVAFGNLVILPIEESILYVQPLFVTADSATGSGGIPELKRVVLVFGEEVAFGESFDEALASLFGLEEEPVAGPPEEEPGGEQPEPGGQARLGDLIDEAGRVYERAQQALRDGDFETYGRLIERLGTLIQQARALSTGGR